MGFLNKIFSRNIKLRIALIISVAVLLVSIVLSVIFGLKLPKIDRKFNDISDNFTNQIYYSSDQILYSTKNSLSVIDKNGTEGNKENVKESMENLGVDIGNIINTYKNKDSEYIWVITQNTSTGKNFLIKVSSDLNVLGYKEFTDTYETLFELDDYVFVITKPSKYFTVNRYDSNSFTTTGEYSGSFVSGNLFSVTVTGSNKVKLELAKNYKIFDITCIEGQLYFVTSQGIISCDMDLNGCTYLSDYKSTGIVPEDVVFNSNEGSFTFSLNKFSSASYRFYELEINSYYGGNYVDKNGNFYLVGNDSKIYSVNVADLVDSGVGDIVLCRELKVELKDKPVTQGKALLYNPYTDKGYIIYDTQSYITCVDLINEKVEYSMEADLNITNVLSIDDSISYTYYNSNLTESGVMIVANVNVNNQLNGTLYKMLFIIFIIVAILFLVAVLVMVLCDRNTIFAGKTVKLLRAIAHAKWIYFALLPSFALLCLFCFYPAIASITLSFFDYTQLKPMMLWNNFKHYINIFTSEYAVEAFSNMAIFLVSDLVFAIIPPLIFAFFLTIMVNKKFSGVARTLLFIPGIIPSIAGLLIWKEGIYGYYGVLNSIIEFLHGEPLTLLTNTETAKWAIIMMGFPFVGSYLIFYGAMMNIPSSYYEAAELEGCGVIKRFFSIDLPLILPQLKYVVICTFIASLQNFSRTYMIDKTANYGTKTPIHIMYSLMLNGDYGYSAAYATVIFIFLLFATIINMKSQFKNAEY